MALTTGEAPANTSIVPTRGRLLVEWFGLLIVATVLVGVLLFTGATSRLDSAIYDFALQFRERPPPADIVIVGIDRDSTARQGEWPWPRSLQAKLLRQIAKDHPKGVAIDVLLQAHGSNAGDQDLRDAMALTPVFLPMVLEEPPGQGHGGNLTKPVPEIAAAAAGLGRGNPTTDADGIVRRTLLFSHFEGELIPQIMMAFAEHGEGKSLINHKIDSQEILIPYAGPPNHFVPVSATKVVEGNVNPGTFTDKYVLVGATARELLDNYPTPSSGSAGMANVEIDANILDAILHNRPITNLPMVGIIFVSSGIVWILLAGILVLQPGQLVVQGAAAALFCLGGSVAALVAFGLWMPPMSVMITGTLLQVVWSGRRLQAAGDYFAQELAELQTRGGVLPIGEISNRLPMGDSVSRQMMLIDETRRRMVALRQFVSELIANLPDPVIVVTPQGLITMCNQSAAMLGERLGRSTHPGDPIQPLLAKLAEGAGEGQSLWPPPPGPVAPRGVAPGGRILEARYAATGHLDGRPTGWTVQLVDVTDIVSAMRQREDAMKLFTHDVRAPQSAILAALDHRDFETVPAKLRDRIRNNAMRTLTLADGFVRLAQAESADYAFEPIDLFHPLGDAADALWSIAEAAKVKTVLRDPGREFVVEADRGLLSRALINLIDNAIKFSQPGTIVVCALAESTLRGRPAVALTVTDQASGMSQEQQQSMFRRFARTRTTGQDGGGAPVRFDSIGLGLSVVHTVVTRHNGLIDCQSEVGGGTTFTITLPLFDEEPPPSASGTLSSQALGEPPRAL